MCSQAERAGADRGTEQSPAWRVLVADHDLQVHAAARAAVQGLVLFGRPVVVLHAQDAARARHLLLQEDDLAVLLLDALLGGAASGGLAGFARQQAGRVNMRIVLRTEARSLALPMLARHDIGDHRRKAELSPQRLRAVLAGAVRAYVQHCRIDANRRSLARIVQSGAALMEQTDLRGFAAAVITQLAGLLGVAPQGLVCVRETGAASGCRVLAATGDFAARRRRLQTSNAALLLHRALVQGLPAHGGASGGLALPMGQHAGQAMAVYVHAPALREAPEPRLLEVFCAHLRTLRHNRSLLERLHQSAYHDALVSLPNRAHFTEQVDACARRGARDHILALLDIDDFSATNDVMGHRFGDRLLRAVAQQLAQALPPGVLLARVGSDTFGVLGSRAQVLPQRLLACVRQPLLLDGVPHKVSLTCGYVLLADAGQTGVDLFKDATIALQRAKREHRGQELRYAEQMGAEARERALLLSELRAAIDQARLYLVYQPQRDLRTQALVGLEALLRWRTADGRLVPPDRFIPVAEHGLQGRHLELEITESAAVLPTQLLESTLTALRAEGISIAVDDFGTGYSSLSYLERLPLDRIKIDRGFVRQLRQARSARIAETVAQLGRRLGLQVLAEGIEDADTLQALVDMGCHEGQGYHIAQPMEREALQAWLLREAVAQAGAAHAVAA